MSRAPRPHTLDHEIPPRIKMSASTVAGKVIKILKEWLLGEQDYLMNLELLSKVKDGPNTWMIILGTGVGKDKSGKYWIRIIRSVEINGRVELEITADLISRMLSRDDLYVFYTT